MARNADKESTAVRLRLSAAQIKVLTPGIKLLVESYEIRQKSGTSPFSYPFRIYPPPRAFDRGTFNQEFMDKILSLHETLNTHSKSGRRLKLALRVDTSGQQRSDLPAMLLDGTIGRQVTEPRVSHPPLI
jgi:hypothetical protein